MSSINPEPIFTAASDIIFAPATPLVPAALAIVRISGEGAIPLLKDAFSRYPALIDAPSHTIHHGQLADPRDGSLVDEVLLSIFQAPRSYTGEDTVEISCHGNPLIVQRILNLLHYLGARPALPGEFTRRAFVNGKMDLSRAEAVADVIAASSDHALAIAQRQYTGAFAMQVQRIRGKLVECTMLLEYSLDFPEEEAAASLQTPEAMRAESAASELIAELGSLLEACRAGKRAEAGARCVFAGPPNAGKSTLFNHLLREERAIISPIPGTTRDMLHEQVQWDGHLIALYDTAGLCARGTARSAALEEQGMQRSRQEIANADIVLFLASDHAAEEARAAYTDVLQNAAKETVILRARTKADLLPEAERFAEPGVFLISVHSGQGVPELIAEIKKCLRAAQGYDAADAFLASERQRAALEAALSLAESAAKALRDGAPELASSDIRHAADELAGVLGIVTSGEVLDAIFSRFCIGK
ncbi:MAG: tRNA uridine-5-carboxymethylaminomethyl(34) synthesis GTPase MnmE [Spirochaetota bacterium]|jgi:tRNA modification GTPase|nr:tRNA uridine-5-carboxymethylaminomethyl(34) synthesis GTPase MnmE [Spirochaetota bacterium]